MTWDLEYDTKRARNKETTDEINFTKIWVGFARWQNKRLHRYKKNKIPWNTTHKEHKRPLQGELQTTAQRNQRGHKQMEKHSMFMVRKN